TFPVAQGCSTTALSTSALARCRDAGACSVSWEYPTGAPFAPLATHCFQGDGSQAASGIRFEKGARSRALLTGHQEHPPPPLWALEWDVWCRSTRGRDKGRIRCRPLRNTLRMLSGDPFFPPLPFLELLVSVEPARHRPTGLAFALASALAFGGSGVFARPLLDAGMDSLQVTWLRVAGAALLLLPVAVLHWRVVLRRPMLLLAY